MVVTADSVKMDSRALATVEKLFWRQIEDGLHPGAALAVYRYGNSVLDLYGGIADTDTGRPVTQDTLFVLYSSTKAITASCMQSTLATGQAHVGRPGGKALAGVRAERQGQDNHTPRLDPPRRLP